MLSLVIGTLDEWLGQLGTTTEALTGMCLVILLASLAFLGMCLLMSLTIYKAEVLFACSGAGKTAVRGKNSYAEEAVCTAEPSLDVGSHCALQEAVCTAQPCLDPCPPCAFEEQLSAADSTSGQSSSATLSEPSQASDPEQHCSAAYLPSLDGDQATPGIVECCYKVVLHPGEPEDPVVAEQFADLGFLLQILEEKQEQLIEDLTDVQQELHEELLAALDRDVESEDEDLSEGCESCPEDEEQEQEDEEVFDEEFAAWLREGKHFAVELMAQRESLTHESLLEASDDAPQAADKSFDTACLSSKEQDDEPFEVQSEEEDEIAERACSVAERACRVAVDQQLDELREIQWLPAEDSDVQLLEPDEDDLGRRRRIQMLTLEPEEDDLGSVHWSADYAEVTVNLMLDDDEMAWRIVLDMYAEDVCQEAELIVDIEDVSATPCDKEEMPTALHHDEQAGHEQVETLKQQIQALKDQHKALNDELERSKAASKPQQDIELGEDCSELIFAPCGAWDSPMSRDEKVMLSLMMSERQADYDPSAIEDISLSIEECFPISWDFPLSRREKIQRMHTSTF